MSPLIALLSAAVLAAGLLFLREVRLRRTLQRLLARLLSPSSVRSHQSHVDEATSSHDARAADGSDADDRLRRAN